MIKVPTSETTRDETLPMKAENFHEIPGEHVFAHIYIRHKHGIRRETMAELKDYFSFLVRDQVRALRRRVAKRHSEMSSSIVKCVCAKRLGRNSSIHLSGSPFRIADQNSPNLLERAGKKEDSQTHPLHVCDDVQIMPENFLIDITAASTLTMLDEGLDESDCHALRIQSNVCHLSSDGQISTTKLLEWWGRPLWAWTRHENLLASGALFVMDLVTRIQSHVQILAPNCIVQLVVCAAQDVDTRLNVSLSTDILLFVPGPSVSMEAKLDQTLIDERSVSPNETVSTLSLEDPVSIDDGEISARKVSFLNHVKAATKETSAEGEETVDNFDEAMQTCSPAIPELKLDENGKMREVSGDASERTESCVLVKDKSSLSNADMRDGTTPDERENAAMNDSIASLEDPDNNNRTDFEDMSGSDMVGHGDKPAGEQGLAIDQSHTSDSEETRCEPGRMAVTLSPQRSTPSNESSGDKLSENLDRHTHLRPGQAVIEGKASSCGEGELIEVEDLCSDSDAEEPPPSEASRHSVDLWGTDLYDATEHPSDDNCEYSDADIIALAASLNEGDNAASKPDLWNDVGSLAIPKSSQIDSDGVDLTVLSQLPPSLRSEARLAMALRDKTIKRKRPKLDSTLYNWLATSGKKKSPSLPPRTIQQPAKRQKGTISDFFGSTS
jgi:hypothetical protein